MFSKIRESVERQKAEKEAERAAEKARPEMMVREYKSARAFNKDARGLARKGWTVLSTTDQKAGSGIGRKMATVAAPILLLVPHSSHVVVTYQRQR